MHVCLHACVCDTLRGMDACICVCMHVCVIHYEVCMAVSTRRLTVIIIYRIYHTHTRTHTHTHTHTHLMIYHQSAKKKSNIFVKNEHQVSQPHDISYRRMCMHAYVCYSIRTHIFMHTHVRIHYRSPHGCIHACACIRAHTCVGMRFRSLQCGAHTKRSG